MQSYTNQIADSVKHFELKNMIAVDIKNPDKITDVHKIENIRILNHCKLRKGTFSSLFSGQNKYTFRKFEFEPLTNHSFTMSNTQFYLTNSNYHLVWELFLLAAILCVLIIVSNLVSLAVIGALAIAVLLFSVTALIFFILWLLHLG